MIKKWTEFIKEFFDESRHDESRHDIIDVKMNELKDLVDNASDGQNILYEWESKDDHQLLINFTINEKSIRYEFDIDDMILTKIVDSKIEFQIDLETIDDGLDVIEKDIQNILGINEKFYNGQWESSISEEDVEQIINKIYKCQLYFHRFFEEDLLIKANGLKKVLIPYDKIVSNFIIDTLLYSLNKPDTFEDLSEEIVNLGDDIMNKYGKDPRMVINAFNDSFSYLSKFIDLSDDEDSIEERVKSSIYKGHKIPGKYLTKNPGKMKKEIDTFRGKKEYKKDWDADFVSGKGGVGKRVKTKKSDATKAYERMFGKNKKNKKK
jgi:hypothetical protein